MEANEAPAASRRSCNPRTKYGVYHILCKSQGIREDGLDVPAAAKSLQSCPTLCDPIDGSPSGSPITEMPLHICKIQRQKGPR